MLSTARRSAALTLALALSIPGAHAWGQAPTAPATPKDTAPRAPLVVRIGVDLVQIDAVVTDKSGRHVTDLKAEDFEVLQDKKARAVSHCRYVVAETAPAAPRRAQAILDIPPPTSAPLRPADVKRSMAFVVDDTNLSATGMYATRQALKKLLDEELRVGDLVAIVRARGGMGILQQFTNDRRVLDAAVDDLMYNVRGLDSWGFSETFAAAANCGPNQFRYLDTIDGQTLGERDHATAAVGAMSFVLEGMRELPGRKSVVLFSESLSLFQPTDMLGRPSEQDPAVIDAVRKVTDLANRGSVVIYTVDPGGLRPGGIPASYPMYSSFNASTTGPAARFAPPLTGGESESASNSGCTDYAGVLRSQAIARLNAQSGLEVLAKQTGGLFFRDENRVATAVSEVVTDQKGYYVIGYTPDDRTFERSPRGGPLFHNLKVRVTRPGLRVRSRAGFIGVTDDDDVRPLPEKTEARLLKTMASPFAVNDVPVRLTAVFGYDAARGYVLRSLVHVDASRLTFVPRPSGGHDTKLELGAAVFGDNGALLQGANHQVSFHVAAGGLEGVQQRGVVIELNLAVDKPGPHQLRVAVRDAETAQTGTASQFVHVPDLGKRKLAVSGVVLGAAPLDVSPDAATEVRMAADETRMSPAVRRFRPGAELMFALAVYNAETARETRKPRLATQLRLVKEGLDVLTTDVATLSTLAPIAPPAGKTRAKAVPGYVMSGTFRLPRSLAPGQYALQLAVTDEATKNKARRSGQWTTFEVVGQTQTSQLLQF